MTEPHPEVAAGAAAPVDISAQPPTGIDALVVRLGTGRFAVSLASVAEVGRIPAVTRVPGVPAWVAGVANWRGRILPVLDLRELLGADVHDPGREGRLTVLVDGAVLVGLLVDGVEGTTALADVAAFPAAGAPPGAGLLSGQAPRDDGPIAVLDVAALVRLRESLPQGRRTA